VRGGLLLPDASPAMSRPDLPAGFAATDRGGRLADPAQSRLLDANRPAWSPISLWLQTK